MLKRLVAGLCALACFTGPVLSQATCEPAKLAAAIDRYAMEPFSARSWRMLKGLGDPLIDPGYRNSDDYASRDVWEKLAGEIRPDAKYLTRYGFDCRIAYPLDVLRQRVATLGKESRYVKQWLHVQDKVLEACTEPAASTVSLPPAMEIHPALAKMQQDDRAYQEAAIAYYRDKEKAVQLFKAIGASQSPHKAAARYNVANLLANGKKPAEARAEAKAILADPLLASVHVITKQLLGYIANLEDTAEGWTALITDTIATIEQPIAAIDASGAASHEYSYALYDIEFAGVRAKADDWWLDGTLPENPTLSKALVDTSRSQPIVLWMMAGQSADQAYRAGPWSLIGDKWQARAGATIGKALAITPAGSSLPQPARDMLDAAKALPDDATRTALWDKTHAAIAAAEKSCGNDPRTAAAGYLLAHAVRLSAMSGHFDEVFAELEKVPFKTSAAYYERTLPKLSEYLLGQGRLAEARTFRDRLLTPQFLAGIPDNAKPEISDRFAAFMGWIAEDEAHWKAALAQQSQKASNLILNFLPARMLWAYAGDSLFSGAERGLLARAAWTRGYARGITQSKEQTEKLYALNPALNDMAAKVAVDYPKANEQRQRLLTILRSPRFGILVGAPGLRDGIETGRSDFNELDGGDPNDKNWWCPFQPDRQLGGLREQFNAALGIDYYDQYGNSSLTPVYDQKVRDGMNKAREAVLRGHPMVRAMGWTEITALSQMASAPKTLSQSAIRWGKASQGDDGAPEALALAVRTTRHGCRWSGRHGSYSKAAQELLQAKFKDTPWARQTNYWFDCMWEEWNKEATEKVRVCDAKTWPKQPPLK
jgi:hypothetical protein